MDTGYFLMTKEACEDNLLTDVKELAYRLKEEQFKIRKHMTMQNGKVVAAASNSSAFYEITFENEEIYDFFKKAGRGKA